MKWLLETLHSIRSRAEKVLIFAEHREMQRLLQHYIRAEFDFPPRIVKRFGHSPDQSPKDDQ